MKFVTLGAEEFRKFAEKSPYKSFTQTPEIAKLREQNGWTSYYFGVEDGGELQAAAMLVAKPTFLGKSTYYCPGGPLMDYENTTLLTFFIKHLKSYLKSHNGYVLHIDPYYELVERTRNGEIKENGFNHQKAVQNLKKLGFLPTPSTQPKYLFTLDLQNKTADQLLAEMKRNTRNHIRKAEKMGAQVRELKREELGIFKQITESTSHRRHFTDRPLSYYEQMYDLFHKKGEVQFMIAEVELENGTTRGLPEVTTEDEGASPATAGASDPSRESAISSSALTSLSAAMFMLYGDEVIYLYSGSDEKYMKDYNAQYLIQWHMIKYATKHGFKTYNFYGINGIPDKSSPEYGIYDFKKGFTSESTGRVVELIGSFELPISPIFYRLHHLLAKLKHH